MCSRAKDSQWTKSLSRKGRARATLYHSVFESAAKTGGKPAKGPSVHDCGFVAYDHPFLPVEYVLGRNTSLTDQSPPLAGDKCSLRRHDRP
jgi:hypothetical protein